MPTSASGKRPFAEDGQPVPGNDHAVVAVGPGRRDHSAGLRITVTALRRIVKRRIEDDHVSPQRLIGNDDGVAEAIIDRQLLADLPRILRVGLVGWSAEDRVGALAEFGVGVEQAQRRVADRVAAGRWPERVSLNVNCPFWLLVQVGQAETLISSLSFSPDLLVVEAELERVVALDPGEAVREGVDRTGGVGRIRTAVEAVKPGDVRGRDAVRDQLARSGRCTGS